MNRRAALRSGDLDACRAILARGSKSFAAASRLLPGRLRDPVAAYYAFCRVSDDAVDEGEAPREALGSLRARVDRAYAGGPDDDPVDRALSWLAIEHRLPRAPIDALLEGYLWDVEGRAYDDLASVRAYAARVAGSVGVAMTCLMGPRDPLVLARAADLGVAMQLTNIARDVGEDARAGRLFLPRAWLREEGLDPDAFLRAPSMSPGVGVCVCRLLDHAEALYRRSERGVPELPADCRAAILAARFVYADIGRVIRQRGYDSVSERARTTKLDKARWLGLSLALARAPAGVARAAAAARSSLAAAADVEEARFLWT